MMHKHPVNVANGPLLQQVKGQQKKYKKNTKNTPKPNGQALAVYNHTYQAHKHLLLEYKLMITRQDYMDGKASHDEYYKQFSDEDTKQELLNVISLDEINKSTDEHMNDIPMKKWDSISGFVWKVQHGSEVQVGNVHVRSDLVKKLKEAGDGVSCAGMTCIYKAQARLLKTN